MRKCAVILAGGVGDYLLGNRHVPNILSKFNLKFVDLISVGVKKDRVITIGNFIKDSFPSFYQNLHYFIVSEENFNPTTSYQYNNFNEEQRSIVDSYDCVFELTTDSLMFLKYELPILKSFHNFPTPTFYDNRIFKNKYIIAHFFQRENVGGHVQMNPKNARRIVEILSKNYSVVCPVFADNKELNKRNLDNSGCTFYDCELSDLWSLSKYCSLCIGISSSVRLFPAHFGIPSLVLFGEGKPFSDIPPFRIRWGIFPERTFPKDVNPELLCQVADNIIKKPELSLYPDIPAEVSDNVFLKTNNESSNPLYRKFLQFNENSHINIP